MTRTSIPRLVLLFALLVALPVTASAGAPAKSRRAATPAPAAKRKAATPADAAATAARRLDDVRIEGELEVPRVTFITVRKPHRFTDYTKAAGVRSSRRLAAETPLPAWIPPPPSTSQESRKENR